MDEKEIPGTLIKWSYSPGDRSLKSEIGQPGGGGGP